MRCETGNPRPGAPAAAQPEAARRSGPHPPRTRIYGSFSLPSPLFSPFPLSCDIFSKSESDVQAELCRRRPSVSAFRLEVSGWDALPAATPTRGTGWGPQRRAADRTSPPAEAEERARPTSGSARGGGALGAQRAAFLAAGSRASRGLDPAALGASSSRLRLLSGVRRALPLPAPLSLARLSALGRRPPAGIQERPRRPRPRAHECGLPQVLRGGSAWKRSPTSSPRCSKWNLKSAGNCSSTQPAPLQSTLALLKRSSSHQSLASPSPRMPRAGL